MEKEAEGLPKLLYTIPEAAKILMVSETSCRDLIRTGYIQALKLGRLKVPHSEIERFLNEALGKDKRFLGFR